MPSFLDFCGGGGGGLPFLKGDKEGVNRGEEVGGRWSKGTGGEEAEETIVGMQNK